MTGLGEYVNLSIFLNIALGRSTLENHELLSGSTLIRLTRQRGRKDRGRQPPRGCASGPAEVSLLAGTASGFYDSTPLSTHKHGLAHNKYLDKD